MSGVTADHPPTTDEPSPADQASPAGHADPTGHAEGQELKLLLVAANHHLASPDLRNLLQFLKSEDCAFTVSLEIADPARQPELLELQDALTLVRQEAPRYLP